MVAFLFPQWFSLFAYNIANYFWLSCILARTFVNILLNNLLELIVLALEAR